MKLERLRSLSSDRLLRLAEEYDIDIESSDGVAREELIEALAEAIEESRREHDASNNHTMRVEERKYDIAASDLAIDNRNGPEYGEAELPVRYNETRMVLLLRDPAWAYAYWDVRDAEVDEVVSASDFRGLNLRLVEMDSPDMGDHSVVDAVDIPVQPADSRWYINLPQQETNYYTELVADFEDNRTVLARSNPISVPRGWLSEDGVNREEAVEQAEALVALSGVERLGVSSFGRRIPQRIISLIDHYAGE